MIRKWLKMTIWIQNSSKLTIFHSESTQTAFFDLKATQSGHFRFNKSLQMITVSIFLKLAIPIMASESWKNIEWIVYIQEFTPLIILVFFLQKWKFWNFSEFSLVKKLIFKRKIYVLIFIESFICWEGIFVQKRPFSTEFYFF